MYYYNNGNIMYDGYYIDDKREGNGKYIDESGEYYIGEFKNSLFHGKGILYYKNGSKYQGINDKYEGKGKYIDKNGNYYIGEWKNGLKYGKGIIYNKNGNILYDGDFIDDKAEGKGKYIYEDGEYYIGEFKNGSIHGKGKYLWKW